MKSMRPCAFFEAFTRQHHTSNNQPNIACPWYRKFESTWQIIEVNTEQLAFDTSETIRFLNQKESGKVEHCIAESLTNYVEGWPSALQLIALQSQHQEKSLQQATDSIFAFNHEHLWDYLAEEAFSMLDQQTKSFLMQCAIFDHFNDELAHDISQQSDALSRIESLHRSGMFLHR